MATDDDDLLAAAAGDPGGPAMAAADDDDLLLAGQGDPGAGAPSGGPGTGGATVLLEADGPPGVAAIGYLYAPTLAADPTTGTPYDFAAGTFTATPAQQSITLTAGTPTLQADGVTVLVAYTLTLTATPNPPWLDSPSPGPGYTFLAVDPANAVAWPPITFRMAGGVMVGLGGSGTGTGGTGGGTTGQGFGPTFFAVTVGAAGWADTTFAGV